MQFSITVPVKNKISEISRNAPSKSPVMPPKIFMQIFFQIIRLRINIIEIITDLFNMKRIKNKMKKKILSKFFRADPVMKASPPDFAKGRLFNIKAIPKRE